MALSQSSSWKLTHPPMASYLIQKENQCIITTWSRPPLTWLTSVPTAPCLNNPWSSNTLPSSDHEASIPRQAGPVSDLCRCHSLCWEGSLLKNLQGCSSNLPSGLCSSPLISKAPPNYPSASPFPIHLMPPSPVLFFSIVLKTNWHIFHLTFKRSIILWNVSSVKEGLFHCWITVHST